MQCTRPHVIKSPTGEAIGMVVPCGKCMSCRVARTREWTVRMVHEMSYWEKNSFVTITYDEKNKPINGSIQKHELQCFIKRLRKLIKGGFKFYACGEYGQLSNRPHYHLILFGVGISDADKIRGCWAKGWIKVGSCTRESIQYVCGYIQKKLNGEKSKEVYGLRLPPFQLQSQGIGLRYALDNSIQISKKLGCTINGVEVGLPRYYRKKLDIDSTLLAEKAIQVESETQDKLSAKGIVTEYGQVEAQRRSREQANKNVNARLSLRDKKL